MPERAALVTGGTRGIGRAIAEALIEDGHAVTITGRKPEGVQRAVAELRESGADVEGIALDHSDPDAPAAIVAGHAERSVASTCSSTTPASGSARPPSSTRRVSSTCSWT